MTTTPLMSLVLPVDHGSAEVWNDILDVAFGLIDAHDHTTGKGPKVPSAGLKINADVSWSDAGVSRSITDLKAIDFTPTASTGVTALAGAFFLSDGTGGLTANELYYRTTAGSNVKFTSGAALNVAAFTGGIGGDYAATGALVDFDDATDSYRFRQQVGNAVRQFARMQSADVDLFEFKANPTAGVPTTRVRLASPAALAGSYTMTMPGALPGALQLMTLSAAGLVSTADLAATALTVGAGLTAAANQHVTVSGTGFHKHGLREKNIGAGDAQGRGATFESITVPTGPKVYFGTWRFGGAGNDTFTPVGLLVGDRIVDVVALIGQSANTGGDVTCTLIKYSASAGSSTVSTTTRTFVPGVGTTFTVSVTGINATIATGETFEVAVSSNDATASDHLISVKITYDHP